MIVKVTPSHRNRFVSQAFTLVEILIVLAIFSVLAAVALPLVRKLVSEQKGANASRAISAFMDATRRRAVSEGRPMGVLIERIDRSGGPFDAARSASIRIRQLVGVPAYSGESSNSFGVLRADTTYPVAPHPLRATAMDPDPTPLKIDAIVLDAGDNQLLALSERMLRQQERNPPIAIGDPIEFPGGRVASITRMTSITEGGIQKIRVNFDLEDVVAYRTTFATDRFPATNQFVRRPARDGTGNPRSDTNGLILDLSSAGPDGTNGTSDDVIRRTKYTIHRRALPSTTAPYELPRGLAIDLNYSGMGAFGNQFAPITSTTSNPPVIVNNHISITFAPDGRVSRVNNTAGTTGAPSGLIFLCLGSTDGLRSDSLLSNEDKSPSNLLDLQSIWIVVNPSTGRVVSSPNASVSPSLVVPVSDPSSSDLALPINQARAFAFLSDTVDTK